MSYLGPRKPRRGVVWAKQGICTNCGYPGSHFVPPSLGERGFFMCTKVKINNIPVEGIIHAEAHTRDPAEGPRTLRNG